jgi:hypothetical protein
VMLGVPDSPAKSKHEQIWRAISPMAKLTEQKQARGSGMLLSGSRRERNPANRS